MDFRGKHKIGKMGLAAIALWIALLAGSAFFGIREQEVASRQRQEMLTMYPELTDAVEDTFTYYEKERDINRLWMAAGIVGGSAILLILVLVSERGNQRKSDRQTKYYMEKLAEQLQQFQKGNYEVPVKLFHSKADSSQGSTAVQSVGQNRQHVEDGAIKWKKIEDTLRELGRYFQILREQLCEEENSTKSLITDISHQLKTPLAALRMSFELAQEDKLSIEERNEFIEKEKQEIVKLELLLTELVNLSRLEGHMIQIQVEPVEMRKTLTEAINQVFLKAHMKRIEIEADIPEHMEVALDPKWTVEAFVNVLDNAVKYSSEDSVIEVRASKLANLVLIEIEDEGFGISTDEIHRIFQRFYRGTNASRQVKEGAGVGLYLTRRILEEQGGTITAKRKAKGTIFRITLPIQNMSQTNRSLS